MSSWVHARLRHSVVYGLTLVRATAFGLVLIVSPVAAQLANNAVAPEPLIENLKEAATLPAALAPVAQEASTPLVATWQLRLEDERIDMAIARWSREAGYAYRWDADRYFPVAAPTAFHSSFEEALRSVLASPGIINSSYPLEACIYANSPPLIRITRLGDQAQECR